MFKISKKIEYSLIVLKHLSQMGPTSQPVKVKDICGEYGIPFDTTSRVIQLMSGQNIIKTFQGANGGHLLIEDLQNVNFLELCELVEQKKFFTQCEDRPCHLIDDCNIKTPFTNLNIFLSNILKQLSIKDLFNGKFPLYTYQPTQKEQSVHEQTR
jgi:Rrf2 family protein